MQVGYASEEGNARSPSYASVCYGNRLAGGGCVACHFQRDWCRSAGDGNIEAVLVKYDTSRVAYADLLSQFWEGHDAAMGNFKPQ